MLTANVNNYRSHIVEFI